MSFDDLRLIKPLVRAVADLGYETPTPIQIKAIPHVLDDRDVLGCAQTGTGKTGAFALPILQLLAENPPPEPTRPAGNGGSGRGRGGRRGAPRRHPRVLVVAPTRELATQIHESFVAYGTHLPLRSTVIFGGVTQGRQVDAVRNGVDIIVATPGRLLDLVNQGHVHLGAVETLVLDEADHMLDMGFIRDIRKIVDLVPEDRQTLLFSATMPDEIRELADSILDEPIFVQAARISAPVEAIAQSVHHIDAADKVSRLLKVLRDADASRTLVFTRTKRGADRLVRKLGQGGLSAAAIHGNKAQNARTRALDGFKAGTTPILVATDIAARGIDVDGITHVVNFDVPNVPETYVHRIGRTARAGASGTAITLCTAEEIGDLRAIERLTGATIAHQGRVPAEPASSSSSSRGRGGGRGGNRSGGGGGGGGGGGKSSGGRRSRGGRGAAAPSNDGGGRRGGSRRGSGTGSGGKSTGSSSKSGGSRGPSANSARSERSAGGDATPRRRTFGPRTSSRSSAPRR